MRKFQVYLDHKHDPVTVEADEAHSINDVAGVVFYEVTPSPEADVRPERRAVACFPLVWYWVEVE